MPIIRIEFDDEKVHKDAINQLAQAIQKIVAQATNIEEVSVYANSAQIKVQVAPIEVFIEMSAHVINDLDVLFESITSDIRKRKNGNSFEYPITLTIIPMKRKFEVGI